MNCEQARQLMHAFVDNEINPQELKKLNDHLDSCESCTVEFEEIKYMVQLMGEIDLKELPLGFEEELHEKLVIASAEIKADQVKENKVIDISLFNRVKQNIVQFKMKKQYYAYAAIPAVMLIVAIASKGFWLGQSNEESALNQSYDMVQETTAAAMFGGEAADGARNSGVNVEFSEAKSSEALTLAPQPPTESTVVDESENEYRDGRMIIQTASVNMDVEKYDEVLGNIKNMVTAAGGYIENESTSYKWYNSDTDNLKYGYMTLRIPAEGYTPALDQIRVLGLVTMDSSNAADITKAYRDTASEIENLKITEDRLREIMAQAVEIEDILAIENELTRVRGSISSYEKQIKDWEALVDMTTITLQLNEVKNLKPVVEPIDDSLFGKAKEGFINTINSIKRSIESFIIWLIADSPIIVILVGLAFITRFIYKKWRKRHEK